MKLKLCLAFLILASFNSFAKKVKFAVDMDTNTVSPNGIHVTGDFQALAGFPGGDWTSNETVCTQEGTSTIYSVIVDIPAFAKYEYKFVNGDQFYEVEFVPVESRVGYDFDDNRWIYVDSLANDTTFVGAIKFSGNAPAGLNLVRFLVDLKTQSTISNQPHVAGNYQNWNPATNRLYSFGDSVFEIINYVNTGNLEYKFINGNAWGVDESVPSGCSVNNNRGISVTKDTVLATVCFASCSACNPTGVINQGNMTETLHIYPNPSAEGVTFDTPINASNFKIEISSTTGQIIRTFSNTNKIFISKSELPAGIYFAKMIAENEVYDSQKFVVY